MQDLFLFLSQIKKNRIVLFVKIRSVLRLRAVLIIRITFCDLVTVISIVFISYRNVVVTCISRDLKLA